MRLNSAGESRELVGAAGLDPRREVASGDPRRSGGPGGDGPQDAAGDDPGRGEGQRDGHERGHEQADAELRQGVVDGPRAGRRSRTRGRRASLPPTISDGAPATACQANPSRPPSTRSRSCRGNPSSAFARVIGLETAGAAPSAKSTIVSTSPRSRKAAGEVTRLVGLARSRLPGSRSGTRTDRLNCAWRWASLEQAVPEAGVDEGVCPEPDGRHGHGDERHEREGQARPDAAQRSVAQAAAHAAQAACAAAFIASGARPCSRCLGRSGSAPGSPGPASTFARRRPMATSTRRESPR